MKNTRLSTVMIAGVGGALLVGTAGEAEAQCYGSTTVVSPGYFAPPVVYGHAPVIVQPAPQVYVPPVVVPHAPVYRSYPVYTRRHVYRPYPRRCGRGFGFNVGFGYRR